MAHLNHKPLLFSFFSLVLFASAANAIRVPHNITAAVSPSPAPTPSYGHISAAPISQPPESAAQAPSNSLLQIPTDAEPTIEKICKSTDYPDVCLAAVTPYLNGKTDLESVLGMAIKASIDRTNLAVAKATAIATSAAITPQMASILGDCKDSYNDALDNYKSAMDALGARDVGTVNSMLSAAIFGLQRLRRRA